MKTNKILLTFYPLISNYPFHNLCQYKKIPTLNSTFLSWYLKWVLTMAPPVGLEPTTHGLTVRRSTDWAKGECLCWHYLSFRAVTRQVLSALVSLTSVFGMGTGGPSQQSIPTHMDGSSPSFIVKSLPASNRFILAHPVLPVNRFLRTAGDPYRIRTDVKGVRGLCLNHLTNGPWCTFTDSNRGPTD